MRLFTIIFFSILVAKAQDFSGIKQITDGYSGLITVEKLAKNINRDFNTDEDKTKALYAWLTKNVRYDLKEFYNPNRQTKTSFRYRTEEEKQQKIKAINEKIVRKTLRTRKAVCEGYARTFAEVCSLLNIENEVVAGHVRNSAQEIGNSSLSANHAWNAVKLNGKWIYIDATWGAGAETNGRWIRRFNPYYYNIPKKKYFKTHFPEKSIWRLRVGRITKEQYYNQPVFSNDFLKTNVTLKSPNAGILKRGKGNVVTIKLGNAKQREFFVGFLGSSRAVKPEKVVSKSTTTVRFVPPPGTKQCFLLMDREVAIEFLID
ncbi:transglutaminase domain-containing protein [Tenacibaculum jejuense]|nr:transglutaminase domain-containing protein [Tenacibaculum jejuense]